MTRWWQTRRRIANIVFLPGIAGYATTGLPFASPFNP